MAVKSMMVTKKSFFIKLDVYVSKEMAVCAVVPLFVRKEERKGGSGWPPMGGELYSTFMM